MIRVLWLNRLHPQTPIYYGLILAFLELKALEQRVLLVLLALLVQEPLEQLVWMEPLEQMEPQVLLEPQALMEQLVPQALMVPLDQRVLMEQLA